VPINALVAVEGTPMEEEKPVEIWEMIRMVAPLESLCLKRKFVYQQVE
jgi:biotin synthase-like enzyme